MAAVASFAASNVFTSPPSARNFVAAAIAAGMAALYTFVKQIGGGQALKSIVKTVGAK